jgi:hypothetical protein
MATKYKMLYKQGDNYMESDSSFMYAMSLDFIGGLIAIFFVVLLVVCLAHPEIITSFLDYLGDKIDSLTYKQ